jgi:hypothetical protein
MPTPVITCDFDVVAFGQGVAKLIIGPLLFADVCRGSTALWGFVKTLLELLTVLVHVLALCAEYCLTHHPGKF